MQNSRLMPSCGCDVAALTLGVWEAALLSVAGSWDKGGGTLPCTGHPPIWYADIGCKQ